MRTVAAVCCLLLAVAVSGNMLEENFETRHLLAAAPVQYNMPGAPLVTGKTIQEARMMAMADDGGDADAAAAKAKADFEEHERINREMVDKITAPFADYSPLVFLAGGCGVVILVVFLIWIGERCWLWTSLSLPSFSDPEIDKRMYPLF
mmetsp:Transcript_1082/g.2379  ORF Transcript_1082/g.2379 Transcript_1082/m.2379 type:complete len:149 (-) Transcript_1082:98-544(-)